MSQPNINVELTVNGRKHSVQDVPASLPLLDFLSDELGLTGTKLCCGIGVCRACTVILHRVPGATPVPILSCSTPIAEVNGQSIDTVEGLATPQGELSPLQQAFLDEFAFQCGYCTPGLLMAARALLERLRLAPVTSNQIDEAILEACGDHFCRCTGYVRYHKAIRKVILATPGLVRDL
ncbi:MAG: (2Fe-2S)-binding protein [Terriglobia bacterium]|jgi:aerobic-type carbon monoxide dehydrogenase small subunit (CoxS/CutS family)